ncbi:unnamed protein product [Lupinus luteus]|uniref:Helicase C-terminal domain-containing protein n=1 Tax=Lupinus luteus TaxID=3873 RepID=A0AAV1WZP0_LUPLU
MDVEGVQYVINYDMPKYTEMYIHRVGRIVRVGETRHSFTLIFEDKMVDLVATCSDATYRFYS